jgi:glycosyltransferase involved in cell wall biosynthesis
LSSHPSPTAARRLIILPSYNSGSLLVPTAQAALAYSWPVWVILDGSTDHSVEEITGLEQKESSLRVIRLKENQGKGGACLVAMQEALAAGFSHALIMDSDGQHPADKIPEFMAISGRYPEAMILGEPIFGAEAPPERVKGRTIGNGFSHLETLWGGINDSLFGFRLYPLAPAVRIMEAIRTARRFDFDTELAVRLFWAGVRPINRPVPVFYPPRQQGGVTHFRYLRDNLLLVSTHTRLIVLLFPRLLRVWQLRKKWLSQPDISY